MQGGYIESIDVAGRSLQVCILLFQRFFRRNADRCAHLCIPSVCAVGIDDRSTGDERTIAVWRIDPHSIAACRFRYMWRRYIFAKGRALPGTIPRRTFLIAFLSTICSRRDTSPTPVKTPRFLYHCLLKFSAAG